MKIDIFSEALIKTYIYAGVTLLIAVFIDYVLRSLIRVPKHFNNKRTQTVAAVTRNIITIVVYTFALYIILTLFGINLTPLLASASIIGVVIGIGAREIIEDFVNGLFLLSLDSIAIGDYVQLGTNFIQSENTEGVVEHIGARTLTLRADNGAYHIIPNGQIKKIINYTRHRFNIFIDLPIKANQDIDLVTKAAESAMKQLVADPEFTDAILTGSQVNGIENFANAEIMTFRITIVTYPTHRLDIARKYRLFIKKEFEKHKIQFA
jgi:small-conductance mechanosensitive channel